MNGIALSFTDEDCCGCHACEVACKQEHLLLNGWGFVRVVERSPLFIPVYCRHCEDAPCMESCPVGAISRIEEGIVVVGEDKCIGCRECVTSCPFGAMRFREDKNVAAKCDLCVERLRRGQAPACAVVCPTGCISWSELPPVSNPD